MHVTIGNPIYVSDVDRSITGLHNDHIWKITNKIVTIGTIVRKNQHD